MVSDQKIAQLQSQMEDLQVRIAFQDDSIAELSDVIAAQDKLLMQLHQQQQQFTDKFKSIEHTLDQGQMSGLDERPPHY